MAVVAGELGRYAARSAPRRGTGMTDKQRSLRTAWGGLAIGAASFINLFTHNRFWETIPVAFGAFAYILYINLKR